MLQLFNPLRIFSLKKSRIKEISTY